MLGEKVSSKVESPACKMDTRETPAAKAAAPQDRLETCVFYQHKELFLPKKNWF